MPSSALLPAQPLLLRWRLRRRRSAQPACSAEDSATHPTPLRPAFGLSGPEALELQWNVLSGQLRDEPFFHLAVESLWNFAIVDMFEARSRYFGSTMDLGQYERFKRVMHSLPFRTLLGHTQREVLSTLVVSDSEVRQRVRVTGLRREVACYTMVVTRQLGGLRDGYWLTQRLLRDEAVED